MCERGWVGERVCVREDVYKGIVMPASQADIRPRLL